MILIGIEKGVDGTEIGKGTVIVDVVGQEVDHGTQTGEAIVVEIDQDPEIGTEVPNLIKDQGQRKEGDGQDRALGIEGK